MSHFNEERPYLTIGNEEIRLAEMDKGGRDEDFIKEVETSQDPNHRIYEDILGYRLRAHYLWSHIESTDLGNLVRAYNNHGALRLRFAGWPRSYPVIITTFKKGLRDGLKFDDALEITFTGRDLESQYPDINLIYAAWQNVQTPGLCVLPA